MSMPILYLILLSWIVELSCGQEIGLAPCIELSTESNDTVDPSVQLSMIAEVTGILESKFDGLSAEESVASFSKIITETASVLIKQSAAKGTPLIPDLVAGAMLQGFFNVSGSEEIISEMVKTPVILVDTFRQFFNNVVDLECFENTNLRLATFLTRLLGNVLEFSLQDQFADIMNATIVVAVKEFSSEEDFKEFIEPVIISIQTAQDADEALSGLLSSLSGNVVQTALSAALQASGFVAEPAVIGDLLATLGQQIRDTFEINNAEFATYIGSILQNVFDSLD